AVSAPAAGGRMKHKGKIAIGGGLVVLGALALYGILNLFNGDGGGFGFGRPGAGGVNSGGPTGPAKPTNGLVITVDGEQYLVDGNPRSLEEVVSAAETAQNQVSKSEPQVLVKMKGTARYLTVEKLEQELKRRGIRY